MTLTKQQISTIAQSVGLDYARLMAFISVESGGAGFNTDGKIIIQFEPHWFSKYLVKFKVTHEMKVVYEGNRKEYYIKVGDKVLQNGVEGQAAEWAAFNVAFSIHPKAAMLSTSIGIGQVMGFNYTTMGYDSVDEMWDEFKKGEYQQVQGMAKFIKNNSKLFAALVNKNWALVAHYYNGSNYKVNNYDTKLSVAFAKYSK
jgi:hypothetical protein